MNSVEDRNKRWRRHFGIRIGLIIRWRLFNECVRKYLKKIVKKGIWVNII